MLISCKLVLSDLLYNIYYVKLTKKNVQSNVNKLRISFFPFLKMSRCFFNMGFGLEERVIILKLICGCADIKFERLELKDGPT